MEKLERFSDIYRLFVATAVSAAAALLLDHLQKLFKDRALQWISVLVLIAIVLFVLDQFLEALIDLSPALRRMILGNDFIEGYWLDLSIDKATRIVHHGTLLTIGWEDHRLGVTGIEFDPTGAPVANFSSTGLVYNRRVLTFVYTSHGDVFTAEVEQGIDQLQFSSPPESYSGFYFDYTRSVAYRIHGTRVDAATIRANNSFRDLASKRDYIVQQIAEAQSRLNTISRSAPAG